MGLKSRKHSMNLGYFHTIDTEEKAYWLGFIAADGNVGKAKVPHTLTVQLQPADLGHLLQLRTALEAEDYPIATYNGYPILRVTSVEMMRDLALWGIVPNKTSILPFPALSEPFLQHYIRGYFDGDGCFTIQRDWYQARVTFCGNPTFIRDLSNYLITLLDFSPTKIDQSYKNVVKLCCQGNPKVSRLLSYLYKDATIWLPRKRDKATSHFELLCVTRKRKPNKHHKFGELFPC